MEMLDPWMKTVITSLSITTLVISSCGYPAGVPDLACDFMFPIGHQATASLYPAPFNIILPKLSYKPGETLRVSIESNVNEYFTGLYVQARRVGCRVNTTQTVGVFTCTTGIVETRHCFGNIHSAVSHKSGIKKQRVTFYWTAPVTSSGHVSMRATIVKNTSTFWTGVESSPMIDLFETDMPHCTIKDKNNVHYKNKRIIESKQGANRIRYSQSLLRNLSDRLSIHYYQYLIMLLISLIAVMSIGECT